MAGSEKWRYFAIKEAYVSAYSDGTAASWVELPLVAEGTLAISISAEDVTDGEGNIEWRWFHSQRAALTIRCKDWAMQVLEMITGNPVSSMPNTEAIDFGREEELTPPLVRFKLIAQSVDATAPATERYFRVLCYKVQCRFPEIGMAETTPGEVTINGDLLKSTYDTEGNACKKCFGRIEGLATSV